MDTAFGVLVQHAKDNHPLLCIKAFVCWKMLRSGDSWWDNYQSLYYENMFGGIVPWNADINWEL